LTFPSRSKAFGKSRRLTPSTTGAACLIPWASINSAVFFDTRHSTLVHPKLCITASKLSCASAMLTASTKAYMLPDSIAAAVKKGQESGWVR